MITNFVFSKTPPFIRTLFWFLKIRRHWVNRLCISVFIYFLNSVLHLNFGLCFSPTLKRLFEADFPWSQWNFSSGFLHCTNSFQGPAEVPSMLTWSWILQHFQKSKKFNSIWLRLISFHSDILQIPFLVCIVFLF